MTGLVEALKADHEALLELLVETEPSLAVSMEATLAKVLVLACASHIEQRTQHVLLDFYSEVAGSRIIAVEFVRNKAISRQFHALFQWDANNANSFFGLFGPDFRAAMTAHVKNDAKLAGAIRQFLELGSLRNQLVHQNYAAFVLTKTADEIYELYVGASQFVDDLSVLLRRFATGADGPAEATA